MTPEDLQYRPTTPRDDIYLNVAEGPTFFTDKASLCVVEGPTGHAEAPCGPGEFGCECAPVSRYEETVISTTPEFFEPLAFTEMEFNIQSQIFDHAAMRRMFGMPQTIYLAGPMRGYDCFNFPAFDAAAAMLRGQGYEVLSPAEHDREGGFDETRNTLEGFDLDAAFTWDLQQVVAVDAIALLPGWETSAGAGKELAVARIAGKVIYRYDPSDGRLHPFDYYDLEAALNPTEVVGDLIMANGREVRVVDPKTGGEKGSKVERFDLIPWDIVTELATLYGRGADKYDSNNWQRGYRWTLSYAALLRHLTQWWMGEDLDAETGCSHLIAVLWHTTALRWFQLHGKGTDDRPEAA